MELHIHSVYVNRYRKHLLSNVNIYFLYIILINNS